MRALALLALVAGALACGDEVERSPEDDDQDGGSGGATSGGTNHGFCGDGALNRGEACDDGNTADSDGCTALCKVNVCGDAICNPDTEADCEDCGS